LLLAVVAALLAAALEIGAAQSRRGVLDLPRLLLYLAAHGRPVSGAVLGLLDQTFQVYNLALKVADALLVLATPSEPALDRKPHAAGEAFCDVCAVADGDGVDAEDLFDLVSEVVAGEGVF
jgi:hypothetical protein